MDVALMSMDTDECVFCVGVARVDVHVAIVCLGAENVRGTDG
jgi:hypothetical protein